MNSGRLREQFMDVWDAVRCALIWTRILPQLRSEWSSCSPMIGDGLRSQQDETSLCE